MSTWYVDNTASGTNTGTSWTNAWQSFAAITWGSGGVVGSDTLYISGGVSTQTYNETLNIGTSGSVGNVILIQTGQDAGHNGQVIINGGSFARNVGIQITNRTYLKISGKVGTSRNMRVTGCAIVGIDFGSAVHHLEWEYLEVDHNGSTSGHGFSGALNHLADYASSIHDCRIHDNYEDGIHIVQNVSTVASQYDSFLIYNNLIDNYRDDGIEIVIGCSVYNNEIGPRVDSGGLGHPDGIQFYNSYTKVYNNYFHGGVITSDPNNSNSNIFSDSLSVISATPNHIQIYDNIIYEPLTPGVGENSHIGIACKFAEGGITGVSEVLIANNTIIGTPKFGLSLTMGSIGTAAVSNVVIENNLFIDVGSANPVAYTVETGDGTITYGSHGSGADVVVDYNNLYASSATYKTTVEWGTNASPTTYTFANFKIASASPPGISPGCEVHGLIGNPNLNGSFYPVAISSAIGAGVDLSTFYTTDKAGVAWTGGTGWGIGALKALGADVTTAIKRLGRYLRLRGPSN